MLKNVQLLYFSPTGGTKACGDIFCKAIAQNYNAVNLGMKDSVQNLEGELIVLALPVYGGRIPAFAAEKISVLNGKGFKAVTLVVYGVRAYEDALLELNDAASAAGFEVVASGAVVAQHSIAPAVGHGRPDAQDKDSIGEFAANVLAKLHSGCTAPVSVPGNHPYKDGMNLPVTPVCMPECSKCGKCMTSCPVGAMSMVEGGVQTDANACILCLACTSACPKKARILPPSFQETMNGKMAGLIPVRRENEFFL